MTATNDITGDSLQSKSTTDAYRDGWDRIFGKKKREAALDALAQEAQDMGLYDREYRCDTCRDTGQVGMGDPCPACPKHQQNIT